MATIRIGRSSSHCGNCGLPASLLEEGHFTNLGYDAKINGTPGCGEPWTAVMFETYVGVPDEEFLASGWFPDFIKALPIVRETFFGRQ